MSGSDTYLRTLAENGFQEADAGRFCEVWDSLEAAYFERMEAVVEPLTGWREQFRAAATETVRLVEAHPAEARFLAVDALSAGELGRERQSAFASRIATNLDLARDELPNPEHVPGVTGAWIAAMFFDRVYRRCTTPDGPDLPSQLPELMFLAVSAYFGTEAGLQELIDPP